MEVRRTVASLMAFVLGIGVGAGVRAQAEVPVYRVGDSWTFERITGDRVPVRTPFTETVKSVGPLVGVRVEPGAAWRNFTPSMNPLDVNAKEIPLLQFPLVVGKKWKGEWDWVNRQYKNFGTNTLTYEVVKLETVRVPAGSFEAYKIEAHGWVNDRVTQWGGLPGHPRRTEIYWYAPAVKRIVKYEGRDLKPLPPDYVETWSLVFELKSYEVKPDGE